MCRTLPSVSLAAAALALSTACAARGERGAADAAHAPTTTTSVVVDAPIRAACDVPELPDEPEEAPRFDFDVAQLSPRGEAIVARVAACYVDGRLPPGKLRVVGFADPRGADAYNRQLGLYRAVAAKLALVARGVPEEAIVLESTGERAARGTDERGWALDRRVEIHLVADAP